MQPAASTLPAAASQFLPAICRHPRDARPGAAATVLCSDVAAAATIRSRWRSVLGYTARGRCRRWHAVSKPSSQGSYRDGLIHQNGNGFPLIEWSDDFTAQSTKAEVSDDEVTTKLDNNNNNIGEMVNRVRGMLARMGGGEISISAYDTAWVAMVPAADGVGGPQFPSSLRWITENQLPDGSWGDALVFSAHDRMINTLACVIALRSWAASPEISDRGMTFLQENMWRLEGEEEEHVTIGFEVAFPSLIEIAKSLRLDLPYHDQALQDIYAMRELKLQRIPREAMHRYPTTLLHSLEGMQDLDWDRLLRLQCPDGSFLFSPSSTAYALMQTRDARCLHYLQNAVDRFDGGVPNVYPVDIFEHVWVADRLDRLGVSRHFGPEIARCVDHARQHWTEDGVCWARDSPVRDVDDTAMAFRLLRLHGHDVSPARAMGNFEKDGEFFCFSGQSNQAVTGIYNLNRAAQLRFLGDDDVVRRAGEFSYGFLRRKQASGQLLDKWIITKDLPGEVGYALDFPFYASLPRVETRLYLEQYGGKDDVWIGKSLYRMEFVNNDLYLQLGKSDFNKCQAIHQQEWILIQGWYLSSGLDRHGVTWDDLLTNYFLAAACVFEPERAAERLAWAKTAVLADVVASSFRSSATAVANTQLLDINGGVSPVNGYIHRTTAERNRHLTIGDDDGGLMAVVWKLVESLAASGDTQLPSSNTSKNAIARRQQLRNAWEHWMVTWRGDDDAGSSSSGVDDRGLLLIRTMETCARRRPASWATQQGRRLARLTNSICNRILHLPTTKTADGSSISESRVANDAEVESEMQELVECVLREGATGGGGGNLISKEAKQSFLMVAKSFYYMAHCPAESLRGHIAKVLFEPVQ